MTVSPGGEGEGGGDTSSGSAGAEASAATTELEPGDSSSGAMPPVDPFEGAQLVTLEQFFHSYAVGDYDGDGDDDLLLSYEHDPPLFPQNLERLAIFALSAEQDAFESTYYQDVDFPMYELVAAHVDTGSTLDAVDARNLRQVAWIDGAFELGPTADAESRLGPVLDLDDDGRVEYLASEGTMLRTYGADGGGGWALEQEVASETGCTPYDAQWGDLDGDGRLDVAVHALCGEETVIDAYRQGEDGGLAFTGDIAFDRPTHVLRLADLDRDGVLDVLLSQASLDAQAPASLAGWTGAGDGTFGAEPIVLEIPPMEIGVFPTAVDIDDDGVMEAYVGSNLVFDSPGILRIESGTFVVTDPIPFDVVPTLRADLNGDGCDDLVGDPTAASGVAVILRACE